MVWVYFPHTKKIYTVRFSSIRGKLPEWRKYQIITTFCEYCKENKIPMDLPPSEIVYNSCMGDASANLTKEEIEEDKKANPQSYYEGPLHLRANAKDKRRTLGKERDGVEHYFAQQDINKNDCMLYAVNSALRMRYF